MPFGIIYSFLTLIGYGVGDFFLQEAARKIGVWGARFWMSGIFALAALPFVYQKLENILIFPPLILVVFGVAAILGGWFGIEALREGKIAVVEPIFGLELPMTVLFSIFFLGESIDLKQGLLIALIFFGLVLTVTKSLHMLHYHRRFLERGVALAFCYTICSALINISLGKMSRELTPLVAIWLHSVIVSAAAMIYFSLKGNWMHSWHASKKHKGIIFAQSLFENMGGVSYVFALSLIPVSIATAISESYVVVAALLGLWIHKERVKPHQILGMLLTVGSVIALALLAH